MEEIPIFSEVKELPTRLHLAPWLRPLRPAITVEQKRARDRKYNDQRKEKCKRRYHYSYAVTVNGVKYNNIHIAAAKLGLTERTIYRMIERGRAEVVLPKK